MSNQRLEVEFRLWNLKQTDNIVPVLVGDKPDLGGWNPDNGTKARFMKKAEYWSVVLNLLPLTVYEWKWVMVDNGETIEWEACPNRRLELGVVGGWADCDWNSPGQFFPDECILFAGIHYKIAELSDALAMVGSSPALGEWNPRCAVVAVEYPLGSGWWVARATLEKGSRQDWKWAVIDKDRNVKTWEERGNRQFESADDMVELKTVWNSDSTIAEDVELRVEHLYQDYEKGLDTDRSFNPTCMQRWGY